jgi:hypothetical protein
LKGSPGGLGRKVGRKPGHGGTGGGEDPASHRSEPRSSRGGRVLGQSVHEFRHAAKAVSRQRRVNRWTGDGIAGVGWVSRVGSAASTGQKQVGNLG